MTDSELVHGLRCRDPAAMQWLSDGFLPSLWRFVYTRVNGDQHLAEDITSDSVLVMLTTIQSPGHSEFEIRNVGAWLRTVAARRISDHFRAVSRVQHLLPQSTANRSSADLADPVQQHELREMQADVRHVMDSLSEQYRLGLEWKYLDKLSVREIAARWKTTEKGAEAILFRARREFRDRLEARRPAELTRKGTRSPATDGESGPSSDDVTSGEISPGAISPLKMTADTYAHEGPSQRVQ